MMLSLSLLLSCIVHLSWIRSSISSSWSGLLQKGSHSRTRPFGVLLPEQPHRGGEQCRRQRQPVDDNQATEDKDQDDDDNDDDLERYSRQVYTLGLQAQSLIRSTAVYLDGPSQSGLLYEIGKDLVLSGIRQIVLVVHSASDNNNADDEDDDRRHDDNDDESEYYYNPTYDDLGRAYQRAAVSELGNDQLSPEECWVRYMQRLNPSVDVSWIRRSEWLRDPSSRVRVNHGPMPKRMLVMVVDRPSHTQFLLNDLARSHQYPFIAVETAGVFGRIFCDFGSTFDVYDVDGERPLVTPFDHMEKATQHAIQSTKPDTVDPSQQQPLSPSMGHPSVWTVHCIAGEKHDLSKGDVLEFQLPAGDYIPQRFAVTNVHSPFSFQVHPIEMSSSSSSSPLSQQDRTEANDDMDRWVTQINQHATAFHRVKIPQTIAFQPLQRAMDAVRSDSALFTDCDLEKSADHARRSLSLACFEALTVFTQQMRRLPTLDDEDRFCEMVRATTICDASIVNARLDHCRSFLRGCSAKLVPLQAVFGAMAAQEALKASTGVYNPIRQFLLYDCDELLRTTDAEASVGEVPPDRGADDLRSSGLSFILGDGTVQRLHNQRVFMVGTGAIGCELLKNLAAMGVGTGPEGKVTLTDMDTIEKSNLSRQLLFRDKDIGQFKSIAARDGALLFNPSMHIDAHSSKVGGGGSDRFDENFWSKSVDVVLNALDNVDARLYIDQQCVSNEKALIDAGTMGPKGNVQVVIPHQSESYSSSVDPPEPSIPLCTIKDFPYAISHTIQWGRELFDGLFTRRPRQVMDVVHSLKSEGIENIAVRLVRERGEELAMDSSKELLEDISALQPTDVSVVRAHALQWAAKIAFKLFFQSAEELIRKHPQNGTDEDGEPFWSGTRRPPTPLMYSASNNTNPQQENINENLIEFIRATARLRTETLLRTEADSLFSVDDAVSQLSRKYTFLVEDGCENGAANAMDRVVANLERIATVSPDLRMTPVEFEKDDDSNGHVSFMTAASNLRALCYGIPPVDAMETRRVAGNIVPAMITTTALVSALSCIELIKLSQNASLPLHRNAFVNLALPFFAFTVPLPAEEIAGIRGTTYTLWDRVVLKESRKAAMKGGITLKALLKRIATAVVDDPSSIAISSVSVGPYMLFANFLHEDDDEVLNSSVWEVIRQAIQSDDTGDPQDMDDPTTQRDHFDLTVVAEDLETGEEVELPAVRLERYRQK